VVIIDNGFGTTCQIKKANEKHGGNTSGEGGPTRHLQKPENRVGGLHWEVWGIVEKLIRIKWPYATSPKGVGPRNDKDKRRRWGQNRESARAIAIILDKTPDQSVS
jgi:hypothetical protein